jgi:acetoin utilization deacetylase AcuC-like enzyme
MKYFFPIHQAMHTPSIDLSDGLPGYKHLEAPSRANIVLQGLLEGKKSEIKYIDSLAKKEVYELHDKDYVDFLFAITDEITPEEEYIPPVFRDDLSASPVRFKGGMYCTEIGTPIGKYTLKAALNSASSAIKGAKYLVKNKDDAFILTRPPGHHAGKRRYGGYCFFNNSYLVAKVLNDNGLSTAIVDIDYHIGDGSLEFAHKKAPYFSLHSNIQKNYPYLQKDFYPKNDFVTLKEFKTGINGETYIKEVKSILDEALKTSPDTLILSLGFDTLESDYCQDEYIYVKPKHYFEIGKLFGSFKGNIIILLEGGYDLVGIKDSAKYFIEGFFTTKS